MLKKNQILKLSLSFILKLLCVVILSITINTGVVYSADEISIDKNSEDNPTENKDVIEVKKSESGNYYPTIEPKHHDTEAPAKAFETPTPTPTNENSNLSTEQKELEKLNNTHNDLAQKLIKSNNPIMDTSKIQNDNIFDQEKNIKEMALKLNPKSNPNELHKMKIHEAVKSALEPVQLLSEEELLRQLLENTKGSKTYDLLKSYPQLTLFSVKLIKHKTAIVDASKILENREKIVKFISVMLLSILFGLFLKKIVSTSTELFTRIIFFFFLRVLIMFVIRVAIVAYFFGNELSGVYQVFLQTFFN